MSGATFDAKAIILKKTKLGESDLILRMLCEDGSLLEAIAKGARKPNSAASARLELFNCASLLIAKGRSLDIIKESKLLWSDAILHQDPPYMAAAATIAEFASKTAQADLEQPRIFDLTETALRSLASAKLEVLPLVVAAFLIKASAILGARPSFSICAICGNGIEEGGMRRFSYVDGGAICDECVQGIESSLVPNELLLWGHELLHSRFVDILEQECDLATSIEVLHLAHTWAQVHFNCKLKSASSLIAYCST